MLERISRVLILCIFVSIICTGCARKEPNDLSKIVAFGDTMKTESVNKIRYEVISRIAMELGTQAGLAWQSKRINDLLEHQKKNLNKIFDFNAMLLDHNVLPPVLTEERDTFNLSDSNNIRISDTQYRIESPPRFVSVAPVWRDYILMQYSIPEKPNQNLLPKGPVEREVWNDNIKTGWKNGVIQANEIFTNNLAKLRKDYTGMILYRKLLIQNMVSAPFVAKADLGVTGNKNSMRINDRVLRIISTSELNVKHINWRPTVKKERYDNFDERIARKFNKVVDDGYNANASDIKKYLKYFNTDKTVSINSRTKKSTIRIKGGKLGKIAYSDKEL